MNYEVKQFSEIEASMRKAKLDIKEQASMIRAMACTPETVKDCKKARADMRKQLAQWETLRKQVKEKILKPYEEFELLYKECISNQYYHADKVIQMRIYETENFLKNQKTDELKEYFEEYKEFKKLDFVSYEDLSIKVTLSESMKKLKETVSEKLDKIAEDVKVIREQEYADEILVEYKQCYVLSQAIAIVTEHKRAIEEISEKQEKDNYVYEPEVEEKFTLSFRVTASKLNLKKLKEFLDRGEYVYE